MVIARRETPPDVAAAGFAAGAALATLDPLVRNPAPWAGAWRRRLALKAAAAALAAEGRKEDEAALRDAVLLAARDADPGPAGRVYQAWRAFADGSRDWRRMAVGLGVPAGDEIAIAIDGQVGSLAPAPLAAAAVCLTVMKASPRARGLAYAAADAVLAANLGWRDAPPLLALGKPDRSLAGICAAYARAAGAACDLYAEFAHAEAKLREAAPILRAKGAGAAIDALLADDALTSATDIPGLSERGLRRLFDRLVELRALRELSGRPTFRLYGL